MIKIIEILNKVDEDIEIMIVNANNDLLFKGLKNDLLVNDVLYPKTLNSNFVMILEIKDKFIKLLSDYLF